MKVTVAIQSGGKSQRMGRDKALVQFRGTTLIERVIARVKPLADELLITSNNSQELDFLGVRVVPDLLPGKGSLGGLFTALSAANHPIVAAVACDLPFVSLNLLRKEVELLVENDADAVVPRSGEGFEPLHAVYRRETCLPLVKECLRNGGMKMISWFDRAAIYELAFQEVLAVEQAGLCFLNVNTPEELLAAEEKPEL